MRIVISVVLLICLLNGSQAIAESAESKQSTEKVESKTKPSGGLKGLSWLVGQWRSNDGETVFEEHWMSSAGGMMVGMGREVKNDKLSFHEYLRLEERADGIYYVAQPFGRAATDFRLTKIDDSIAVFENPQHDFPNCIKYKRRNDGSVQVLGSGMENAKPKSFEYVLHKKGF